MENLTLCNLYVTNYPVMSDNWGTILKHVREGKGIGQTDLARMAGLNPSRLSRIEKGEFKKIADDVVQVVAPYLDMTVVELRHRLYGEPEHPLPPAGTAEEWAQHATRQPLKVSVYPDYAKVHAGQPSDAIDEIFVDRPEKAPFNIKAYRVEGDCMEPEIKSGWYVIVDHDAAINNGDKVVCLIDGELHLSKLKAIAGEYFLENRYSTRKLTECHGVAKVIGHYGKYA